MFQHIPVMEKLVQTPVESHEGETSRKQLYVTVRTFGVPTVHTLKAPSAETIDHQSISS